MDLWIRSQDKETLILTQHLDMYEVGSSFEKTDRYVIEESGTDLGEYKTKERALEVLDEIQQHINNMLSINVAPSDYVKTILDFVYEMPVE